MRISKAPAPINKIFKLPERKLVVSKPSKNKISTKCSESEIRYSYWFPEKEPSKKHPKSKLKSINRSKRSSTKASYIYSGTKKVKTTS